MADPNQTRRLTEREVAVVLRRAVEIDEASDGDSSSSGLRLDELREIATEVGIRPEAIEKALVELESGSGVDHRSILGPAATHSTIRSVPGRLGEDQLRNLIQVADTVVAGTGVVSEALGAVRWTSQGRFLNTQIAVSPSDEGTSIRVHEQFTGRVRRAVFLVPGGWGAILGASVASSLGLAGLAVAGFVVASAAVGVGVGRATWGLLARRSQSRVHRLAGVLEQEALQHPDHPGASKISGASP